MGGPETLISDIQARQGRRTQAHRQAGTDNVTCLQVSGSGQGYQDQRDNGSPCSEASLPSPELVQTHTCFLSVLTFNFISHASSSPPQSLAVTQEGQDTGTWRSPGENKVLISRDPKSCLVFLKELCETLYIQRVQLVHLFLAGPPASLDWNRGTH